MAENHNNYRRNNSENSAKAQRKNAAGSGIADYRRILSYLYRYENANRKSCCGFIKAEQKSGNLKLTAQIDDNRLLNGMTLKLYFYEMQNGNAQNENFKIWHLSDLTAASDQKEWQISFSEKELPAGFSITKQSGVVLFYQESYYYGSVWIGEEIPKGIFSPKQKQEEKGQELSSERGDGMNSEEALKKSEPPEEVETEKNIEAATEASEKAESEAATEMKEEIEPKTEIELKTETKPETETKLQAEESREAINEAEINEETGAAEEDRRDIEEAETMAEAKEPESLPKEPQVMSCESDENTVDRLEKMWINSVENRQPVDNIFNPAFYKGYKISVGQLEKMGEEAAAFSENQFLLKGYEKYHHLLAGKVRYGGEDRYCVGVPGIYENREKYMAEIYQFPIFLSLTENRIKTGGFGYWLHILKEE